MKKSAGYSGTPLAKKLGIKPGYIIRIVNAPEYYFNLFSDFPDDVKIVKRISVKKNLLHFFTKDKSTLEKNILKLKNEIFQDGMIWISWPKKSSKIFSDMNENDIRTIALNNGLVDVKVCAIDENWSGLKLVIPLKDRQ